MLAKILFDESRGGVWNGASVEVTDWRWLMSALHTPGPWTVGRELNSGRPGSIPIEAASRESLGGRMHVAFVNGKAGEQEANARLIASSPEAHAACVELITGDGTADSLQRAIDLARAALIKARRI